jgi:hypothetical protein
VEGLAVSLDNELPCFVYWRLFKRLMSFRSVQGQKEVNPPPAGNGSFAASPVKGVARFLRTVEKGPAATGSQTRSQVRLRGYPLGTRLPFRPSH